MSPTEQQLLLRAIQEARAPIAAFTIGLAAFSHPFVKQMLLPGDGHKACFTTSECPTLRPDQNNRITAPGRYELPLTPSLEYISSNPRSNLTFINMGIRSAILHVGDAFSSIGYFDRSPEIEFLRHTRNAVAHGNRFNITGPLKLPASFRSYSISISLNGSKLFSDQEGNGYLHEGDALALLDYLELKISSVV